MRVLAGLVIVMGVLILVATAALIGVAVHRAGSSRALTAHAVPAGPVALEEPPGTRIALSSLTGERLVLQLVGGGPDRVLVLDLRTLTVVARVGLAH